MNQVIKSVFALLFTAGLLLPSFAQDRDSLDHALLWEISSPTLDYKSYLFGTIHMIPRQDFYLDEAVEKALEDADQIAFEIDMEEMSDMGKMMGLLMDAFMKGDTTLSDLLTEEEYELVDAHFQKVGLPLAMLERIKPMFLTALTSEDLFTAQPGGERATSYELELMQRAKSQEKPINGLETAEYQMSMFDSIPYRVQAKMLVDALAESDPESDQIVELVRLYKEQDLNGMQRLFQADESGLGKYEELLLVTRNRNWIPVMREMMEEGPTFFAVGAGHLVGSQGVIRLLEAEGYGLRPMPFEWPQ